MNLVSWLGSLSFWASQWASLFEDGNCTELAQSKVQWLFVIVMFHKACSTVLYLFLWAGAGVHGTGWSIVHLVSQALQNLHGDVIRTDLCNKTTRKYSKV
jgi:hypothetical protein